LETCVVQPKVNRRTLSSQSLSELVILSGPVVHLRVLTLTTIMITITATTTSKMAIRQHFFLRALLYQNKNKH